MIKVITFDLDDTLWCGKTVIRQAEEASYQYLSIHHNAFCQRFSLEAYALERIKLAKAQPHLAHNLSQLRITALYQLLLELNYDTNTAKRAAEEAFAVFLKERHRVNYFEDALHVLATLKKSYVLGALTNGNADIFTLEAGGYFDFMICAESVGFSKPHPAMFQAVLEQQRIQPHELLHVGDHPEQDILGANALAIKTIWFNPRRADFPFEPKPTATVTQLKDIPEVVLKIIGA